MPTNPRSSPTPFPIPVRSLMPEPTDDVDYMPMPREMHTFEMPAVPEPGPGSDVAGAHRVLQQFLGLVDEWLAAGTPASTAALPALDLARLPAATLRVVNETLGEGEVSAIVEAAHEVRVQETVFSGVWREQHLCGTHLLHDHLMAAPIPPIVLALAQQRASGTLRSLPLPAGAMNVPALLHELQDAMDKSGPDTPAHVLNLTLLPLSPEDSAHLAAVLDGGSVVVLSRGFGNCRISSTAARNVWRVQYFNTMHTLILDTVEVVSMPEVAVAATEDIAETRHRLHELVQWMGDTAASA